MPQPPSLAVRVAFLAVSLIVSPVSAGDRERAAAEHPPFRPLTIRPAPAVDDPGDLRTPIDAWVVSRLRAVGLHLNPEAPRATLLRRIAFDLTGLPLDDDLRRDAMTDDRPDWYERTVDRLLASPAFAEHWGKHWLDASG
ncbi:MAG: DUF1549 domain-containing protein, partial [Planctomycetota bacterium]|nr:DUF1549 domain-containing protein [Planctomycetota bacterium]